MKRVVILLLAILAAIAAYKIYAYRRDAAELERLGKLFDADLADYLSLTWPRTPLPGEPMEGFALDRYRAVAVLGGKIDEEISEAGGDYDWEVEEPVEEALEAWIDEGVALPATAMSGLPVGRMRRWLPALDLADEGTRCTAVGPRASVTSVELDDPHPVGIILSLRDVLLLAAAVDAREGRVEIAARRALVLMRVGDDLARGATLIDEFAGNTVHVTGTRLLGRLLAEGRLDSGALADSEEALRAGLRDRLPDCEVAFGESLGLQFMFRLLATEEEAEDWFGIPPSGSPLEQAEDWLSQGISLGEIAAAWRKVREIRVRLEVASKEGDEAFHAALAADQGWSDSSDTRWFTGFASVSFYPRLFMQREEQRRADEALVLACRALLLMRESGAFPASIEEIRPEEVRAAPDGGEWRILPEDGSGPARIRLVVEGEVVHEVEIR